MNRDDWDERHGDDVRLRRWAEQVPRPRGRGSLAGQGARPRLRAGPPGIDKARIHAAERRVEVEWVNADLLEYAPEEGGFDLVLVFYLHVPLGDRRAVLRNATVALAPGGTFLLVGHDRTNLDHGYGGPHDPRVLYTSPEIVADLAGLEIERTARLDRPVQTEDGDRVAFDLLVRARRPLR